MKLFRLGDNLLQDGSNNSKNSIVFILVCCRFATAVFAPSFECFSWTHAKQVFISSWGEGEQVTRHRPSNELSFKHFHWQKQSFAYRAITLRSLTG